MSIPQSGGGPIEEAQDLVRFLENGCKPKSRGTIGTEHEKFGFHTVPSDELSPYFKRIMRLMAIFEVFSGDGEGGLIMKRAGGS
jgi:gamma-glutamylcysteine synthetase